jgi:L-lactate dehydrogenase complex protein LldG
MSSREEILARVRTALVDVPPVPPEQDVPQAWVYQRATAMPDVLDRFVEMCEDYRAEVLRVRAADVPLAVARLLREAGAASVVLPPGIEAPWRQHIAATGIQIREDRPALSRRELNEIDAVVTASAVSIAETGTIVLDHGADQGRRALSLVPDLHVCVVAADQVVSDVPEAVGRLAEAITAGQPLTWISGPSATSDIELSRVEGVHGPRTLVVILSE